MFSASQLASWVLKFSEHSERGVDRLWKHGHPQSYFRALARTRPYSGTSLSRLKKGLQAAHAALLPPFAEPQERWSTLPGLQLVGDRVFYARQPITDLPYEEAEHLRALLANGRYLPEQTQAHRQLIQRGLLFESAPTTSRARPLALVLSPHHDDAPLALGGTMFVEQPHRAFLVINAFTVSGWVGEDLKASSIDCVTSLREKEELLSSRILGVQSTSLDLWEIDQRCYSRASLDRYPVRKKFRFGLDPSLRTPGEEDTLRKALTCALDLLRPERLLLPLCVGNHSDHLFLRKHCFGALKDTVGLTDAPSLLLYEDQPYSTYEEAAPRALITTLDRFGGSWVPEYVDITEGFEAKMQSIAAHRSQFRREENEARLRAHAVGLGREAGMAKGALAERLWRWRP